MTFRLPYTGKNEKNRANKKIVTFSEKSMKKLKFIDKKKIFNEVFVYR